MGLEIAFPLLTALFGLTFLFGSSDSGDEDLNESESEPQIQTVTGTSADDLLVGSDGNETLVGEGGDDTIDAGDGDDLVEGGEGRDLLDGGPGNDTLYGQADLDTIFGGEGDDLLEGGEGNDLLVSHGDIAFDPFFESYDGFPEADLGADTLDGGAGNDSLVALDAPEYSGPESSDLVLGGGGNDHLVGDAGDTLSGGNGADRFEVLTRLDENSPVTITDFDPSNETLKIHLFAEDGAPTPISLILQEAANGGADIVNGADVLVHLEGVSIGENIEFDLVVNCAEGQDVTLSESTPHLFIRYGNDTITGSDGDDDIYSLGGTLSAGLQSAENADIISTGAGNDTVGLFRSVGASINTGTGDDSISFGTAYDLTLDAGEGDDQILFFGKAEAEVTGGSGIDTFNFSGLEHGDSTITDFDPATETLNFYYSSSQSSSPPTVTFEDTSDGSGLAVLLNGNVAVTLAGLTAADSISFSITDGFPP